MATSHPLATRAGLRMLEDGGNAADAAIAAAAVLCVCEPMSTGLGGDAFALLWRDGEIRALDAAGPAPVGADPEGGVDEFGPRSVTVPGAVAGWAELAGQGKLGLDRCLAPAIDCAERGFALTPHTARRWTEAVHVPEGFAAAPATGSRILMTDMAKTLRAIAEHGPEAFYRGPVARAMADVTWLEESDLGGYEPSWVEPLTLSYRGVDVIELPPPTQGVVALEALGILEKGHGGLAAQVHAARTALADGSRYVRDGADVNHLLTDSHLERRALEAPDPVADLTGGTVYLCVVDDDRMAVSFIQSVFQPFGSGLVAPGTGVVLSNRAACFAVNGGIEPGRRPYNTTIPGMLVRDGRLWGPFGVMGGFIQAQAHMRFVSGLVDDGLDPQAALDLPRFRVDGELVRLEPELRSSAPMLRESGFEVLIDDDLSGFGGGQAILVEGDALFGASDCRKDGHAAGS